MTSRRGSNAYRAKSRAKLEDAASLDQARRYRLVRNPGSIVLMCPKEGEKKEAPVDLSYLLAFPHLTEPFAQAVQEVCKSKALAYASCDLMGRELKTGFFTFLTEKCLNNIRLEQLTTSHVEGFKNWLDRVDQTAIYALQTRQTRMGQLRKVVRYLKQSDKWTSQLDSDLHIRPGMWTGQKGGHKPTPVIHAEDYRKIYQACKKEIVQITERVKAMRAALQANLNHAAALAQDPAEKMVYGKGVLRNLPNPYNDLGVMLATLHRRFPQQILTLERLNALNDRSLASAVMYRRISNIISCFYPSARDLVPFVLMMAIHLDYNKTTLMGSKVSDYRIFTGEFGRPEFAASASLIEEKDAGNSTEEIGGEKLFRGAPVKKRALYRPQVRICLRRMHPTTLPSYGNS